MIRILIVLCLLSLPAFALVQPDEVLSDPALEARARTISKDIICPVCTGQNIDESESSVARDLRLLIRKRLSAGDNNEQVFAYLQERYGDVILMNPPLGSHTALLWAGPFIIFLLGGIIVFGMIRRKP